ncbi:hypothetical protein Clacol_008033 [Clathrus columnatus]|uniref:Serine/threonine-protein phosphatase n=1 Tax=Clathrus columnatus TaxID=1419009 RepID=A0AAV5AMX5_9AGAM|nr:hypothetical protein Clacol_008033 [Clathrus columnatus]
MDAQAEKAYQKQHLFQNAKVRGGRKVATKDRRWFKDVGLGFKTPTEAINGTYIDKKCPFTGNVAIRGRILTGKVVSTKMTRTIIIRRDYLHYISKYNRYEKRHKNLAAHVSPAFRVELGDMVTVGKHTALHEHLKVAPLTSFLARLTRSHSPAPPSMGNQPSKRSKKSKDKDTNPLSTDDELGGATPSEGNTPHNSISKSGKQQLYKTSNGNNDGHNGDDIPSSNGPPVSASTTTNTSNGVHAPNGSTTDSSMSPQLASTTTATDPSSSSFQSSPDSKLHPDCLPQVEIPNPSTILSNPTPLSTHFSPGTPLSSSAVADANMRLKSIDIDDMIQRLLDVGYTGKVSKSVCLKNTEITAICSLARDVFLSQPTLIELSPPVKIVGDVHGQYSDLIRLFEMCGFPPSANYLFLGDYVDRGKQSLETILLLLCYKLKYPENFFLLRGNHECANVTRVYGFYDECKRRCNIKIWKTFIDVFNCLPIAAIVASKIFCVHGGLSPSLHSMEDIRRIQRPTDVPDYGLLNDLLWSDPSDTALDWEDNERGVSFCFGKAIINDFLGRYDMDLICRAHMVVEDGYEFWNERTLVTVFSAPNYCGEFDNYGACMSVSDDLLCAFELLKPLDGPALRKEMTKAKRKSLAPPPSPGV